MRIVADSNILAVKGTFEQLADLRLVPGREITNKLLRDADVLLVRSITPVDRELLQGTPVKFVGTATSGTDHIDQEYLQAAGIEFADARGSNAHAVVDYCLAALAFAIVYRNMRIDRCRVGIIGAGHVGGLFARKLRALGIAYKINDPPLQRALKAQAKSGIHNPRDVDPGNFCTLDEVLHCDIVSLHVPLISGGEFPTNRLLGTSELAKMRPDSLLINTCRGSVVSETALKEKLQRNEGLNCIVDVWEGEPDVSPELIISTDIATPHIAGYSQDAKLQATHCLLKEMVSFFGLPSAVDFVETSTPIDFPVKADNKPHAAWRTLLALFPLVKLSEDFRNSARQGNVAIQFDAMRKRLLSRREFRHYRLDAGAFDRDQCTILRAAGVQLD